MRFWIHRSGESHEYLVEADNEDWAWLAANDRQALRAVPIHELTKDVTYCYSADPPKGLEILFSEVSPLG